MSRISTETRRELVTAIQERYRSAPLLDKQRILDEFVARTGYHRKYAIRILGASASIDAEQRATPPRERIYGEAVGEALGRVWEAAGRICGKRLKPLLPTLVAALERHGHLSLDPAVRERLVTASAATIDRLLATRRATAGGRRHRSRARSAASRGIPIRTFADWQQPEPGCLETDLVAHCGDRIGRSCVHTLVLTDRASGWTECIALRVHDSVLVIDALDRLRTAMPFPVRGLETEGGSELIDDTLLDYCGRHGIEFTCSRPYHKNDGAWIEHRTGSVARRLVGDGRLEGLRAVEGLDRLYTASRLFVNFFQASFRLKEKLRTEARVTKRYHAPQTPCARLLASPTIAEAMKQRLRSLLATLDPMRILDEIRAAQRHLAGLATAEALQVPEPGAGGERAVRSLATAGPDGAGCSMHGAGPKPPRHWRTRRDPFEAVWPRVVAWLESEPDATAKGLLQRLQSEAPGSFPDGLLRTLQRRVKAWRRLAARRLVLASATSAILA